MTFDMDFVGGTADESMPSPVGAEMYSASEIDFYGDENLADMERIDIMLSACDSTDIAILSDVTDGQTYEKISEKYYLAINTVKYRVKKMMEYTATESRKELIALLESYKIKFKNQD